MKDKVRCFVDEKGCYMRDLGYDFEGKNVLGPGKDTVLERFRKDIVHIHSYVHQYPYDWRTGEVSIFLIS